MLSQVVHDVRLRAGSPSTHFPEVYPDILIQLHFSSSASPGVGDNMCDVLRNKWMHQSASYHEAETRRVITNALTRKSAR